MFLRSFVLSITCAKFVAGQQCNEEDHHPENGGYFIVGAAGESDRTNLDSAHGQKLPDATWSASK